MKSILFLFCCSILSVSLYAQPIKGRITNQKHKGLANINVFISGSYDGGYTDSLGYYQFKTEETGQQILMVSSVGYISQQVPFEVKDSVIIDLQLVSDDNKIETVVIRPGQLSVGNQSSAVLTPLDIVTTAGSMGNIVAAIGKLPGAQIAGENGRLMVRGGDPSETQTYINGILVTQPYTASANGVPV